MNQNLWVLNKMLDLKTRHQPDELPEELDEPPPISPGGEGTARMAFSRRPYKHQKNFIERQPGRILNWIGGWDALHFTLFAIDIPCSVMGPYIHGFNTLFSSRS
jgi:hypothetical protein